MINPNKYVKRVMFDVKAKEDITIKGMKTLMGKNNGKLKDKGYTFQLWTRDGSFEGHETTLTTEWTEVQIDKVVFRGDGELSDIVFKNPQEFAMSQGDTRGFYIDSQNKLFPMKKGTKVGDVCSQANDLLDIKEGKSAKSLSSVQNAPLIWGGQLEITPASA
eukprot:CAMPEP_0171297202 /NCGR_PEP_ID=MMETSP0816-20121228/5993_1 /TAXON_ID=420281 /ORGANISM="Proboscia inermis, Strain CCAP1064/1" /LENGTH=161 /DNA_ID=CAMNT_0011771357 /DNA_START=29 /DNA_END=514 /DNA_ORIENTATION=-